MLFVPLPSSELQGLPAHALSEIHVEISSVKIGGEKTTSC